MLATLRHRNFALLWLGGLISFVGDWALFIALPVFVYDLTGSTLATGGMFMAQSLPRLLLGSIAGVFVDRWDRRRTMIVANLLSAAVLLLLLLVRTPADLWLLYTAAFVQTTVTLFFSPAESALVPHLVGEDQLLHANALTALNWELTRLIAPPLGGLAMVWFGFGSVIMLDAVSFLLSAGLIALITQPGEAALLPAYEPRTAGASAWLRMWSELAAGLRLVWRDQLIRSIFLITATAMVAEGLLNVLSFPWLKLVLHGGALERGWLSSAQAIGGLVGGLLIGRAARLVRPAQLVGVSGIMLGLLMLAYVNVDTLPIDQSLFLPAALLIKVLQGVPIIGMFVSVDTLLQQNVVDRYRGRIFGAYGATAGLAVLLGQALASMFGDRIGIIPVLDMMGLAYLLAGLLALLLLRGQALTQSAPAGEQIGAIVDVV
jgi:MFS family permease